MKTRLQLKPKNKVRVKTSVKLTIAGAAFAFALAMGFFLFDYFTRVDDTLASDQKVLPGYAYRRIVQLNSAVNKSAEVMRNFPLLVRLQHPDLRHIGSGGKVTHKQGFDIRFTKSDGLTILTAQIEQYNPTDGALSAWVLLDSLAPGKAPEMMLYYSNSSAQSEQANLVWTGDIAAVWHMHRDLNGLAGAQRLRATVSGTQDAEGIIAGARQFKAFSGDFADYGFHENLQIRDEFSITAMVKPEKSGKEQVIVSTIGDAPGGYRLSISNEGHLDFGFVNAAGNFIHPEKTNTAEKLPLNEWTYIAATYSRTSGMIHTYVNGISDRSLKVSDVPLKSASALLLGNEKFREDAGFTGLIDEVRILHKALPQSWLAAEYLSLSATNGLATLFDEQPLKLDAATARLNKSAMQSSNRQELDKSAARNQIKAQKSNTEEAPTTVSTSAQGMRDKMQSIRKVSTENGKP